MSHADRSLLFDALFYGTCGCRASLGDASVGRIERPNVGVYRRSPAHALPGTVRFPPTRTRAPVLPPGHDQDGDIVAAPPGK